jgi:putative flavoprotein involved in K+ transport
MTKDAPSTAGATRFVEEGAALMELARRPSPPTARDARGREAFDVIVVGAGQAGLSVGYHLARHGLRFVILDAGERIGDPWRKRWDSLRLFTPARFDGLDGMPFPAPPDSFPTKDEMADYLEAYARRFSLPVRTGVTAEHLRKEEGRYVVRARGRELEAAQVVVAMANYQRPRVPAFARELRGDIVQLHSCEYRNPSQLREGAVLLVGAGNSGSEIAMELARRHRVFMSGRDTGHVPFRIEGFAGRVLLVRLVLKGLFHHVLTVKTPIGRRVRPTVVAQGGPLIRVKPRDLVAAGVERVPRTADVDEGRPRLADGRVLDVTNVVWCTGFHPGFSWIDLPIFDERGEPRHESGRVESEPGLYFVGLHFLHAMSSAMIHGVGRDAARIAAAIANYGSSFRTLAQEAASPPEQPFL